MLCDALVRYETKSGGGATAYAHLCLLPFVDEGKAVAGRTGKFKLLSLALKEVKARRVLVQPNPLSARPIATPAAEGSIMADGTWSLAGWLMSSTDNPSLMCKPCCLAAVMERACLTTTTVTRSVGTTGTACGSCGS